MPDQPPASAAQGPVDPDAAPPAPDADPAPVEPALAEPTPGETTSADAAQDEPTSAVLEAPSADPDPEPGAVPSEEWLAAHAVPGRVRRAPRLGSFVVVGVLAGMVVGTLVTLLAVPRSGLSADGSGGVLPILGGYNGVLLETSLALGLVGGLVGAVLALRADRRSRR
ncbi:hypothetical protein [Cellulomonas citrea]|uniref:hypothetical protein n=1 Tax=Cellulomonas citrea TaxID=1909423 RepID=UPI0013597A86|nr:hypothetical protein [Cellulomonas citrea]